MINQLLIKLIIRAISHQRSLF